MRIEIINVEDIPAGRIRWKALLDNLPYNESIKLTFDTKDTAKKHRNNLVGSIRKSRQRGIKVHTQVSPLDDGQWGLFIWKGREI